MAIQPMALQVANPQFNAVADFQTGEANALNANGARMNQEAAALQQLAEAGYGVLDHNLDGPINQERFGQMLNLLGNNPLAEKLKANPELIRTITKSSLNVLQAKNNEAEYQLRMKNMEQDVQAAEAAASAGPTPTTGYAPIPGKIGDKNVVALPGNNGKLYVDGKEVGQDTFTPTDPYQLNYERANGRAVGTAVGQTQFSVPQAEKELAQSLEAIGQLNNPDIVSGKDEWFKQWGVAPRGMAVMGGSNMAKFQNVANNLIDRSWLSARAMLKGAGQVTDYEGAKAENAVSMMKGALDKGDKASYEAAVADYEYWIKQGFAKMQQQAGATTGYGGANADAPVTPAQQGGGGNPDDASSMSDEDILTMIGQ